MAAVRIFDEPFDHPTAAHRHAHNRLVYVYDLPKAGAAARWHIGGRWRTLPFTVDVASGEVLHNGNFHGADLALAFDTNIAAAEQVIAELAHQRT